MAKGDGNYTQIVEIIPRMAPGAIRDLMDKETKKVKPPTQNSSNISADTTPKSFKQINAEQYKALVASQRQADASSKVDIMGLKSHMSDNAVYTKELGAGIEVSRLERARIAVASKQQSFLNQTAYASSMTNESARRAATQTEEKHNREVSTAATKLESTIKLATVAVDKHRDMEATHIKTLQAAADIRVDTSKKVADHRMDNIRILRGESDDKKAQNNEIKEQKQAAKSLARQKAKALDKEQREIENGQKQAAKSLARQKSKELGKYNGLSVPQIAVKGLSEKINTSLTSGLTKAFGGKAMSGALSKSIVSGVSTAAAGAVVGAVAVGAVAMVTLMLAPFKLMLSFSQKAFNFLKGIATQTETFKKLMELVMMPFVLMFTLLFAPVLMALAPILTSVIQYIASKQDTIMAVGDKIAAVIEKLFDDNMIDTYIALIDQVVSAIEWFVGVVRDNLTFGDSIFETIVLTFTKVMTEVLVAITRWVNGPEGMSVINELSTLIGKMIGVTAAFIVTLLPAIFSALEPALKGIFQGVIEFFGDLIIAGVLDLFGIDSDLANIFKSIFSLIGEVVGAAATFLLAPLASLAGARDTLSDIASSIGNIADSITNYNSDNRVSNVDNTHINFDIHEGAGATSLVDSLTSSLRLNGVI